jgi:hypothetical protein
MKDWRRKRKEKGIGTHSPERLAKQAEWLASTYRQLRSDLYDIVGRECVGGGLNDVRVLEFDHINDDGAIDRIKFKGARTMLEFYTKNPTEAKRCLQTLCRNCNWIKRKGFELPLAGRLLDGIEHNGFPNSAKSNG